MTTKQQLLPEYAGEIPADTAAAGNSARRLSLMTIQLTPGWGSEDQQTRNLVSFDPANNVSRRYSILMPFDTVIL